jgi:hypothetical protein
MCKSISRKAFTINNEPSKIVLQTKVFKFLFSTQKMFQRWIVRWKHHRSPRRELTNLNY